MGVVRLTLHSCLLVLGKVYAPALHVAVDVAVAAVVFVTLADVHTPALPVGVFAALVVARTAVAVAPPACFFEMMLVPLVFVAVLSLCILLAFVSSCCFVTCYVCAHAFWEQACGSSIQMPSEIPSITEIVVALNELNLVASGETQLISASGCEVICNGEYQSSLLWFGPSFSSSSSWLGRIFVPAFRADALRCI